MAGIKEEKKIYLVGIIAAYLKTMVRITRVRALRHRNPSSRIM